MKFGLIGYPIAHSLSPKLFKAGYDGKFPYELIETPDFEEAYQRFLDGYDGINVTAPFKEVAIRKADILSEECEVIGATNLMVKTPEGVKAYNSDYLGVRLWLSCVAQGTARVLIVGLGGAGKAAAAAAESLGMKTVLMNRTLYNEDIRPLSGFCKEFREADIIIYNLPVAIPQLNELASEDFTPGKRKILLEANYRNPSFDSSMVDTAQKANPLFRYVKGETWLLAQALTGYEIFTGEKPDLSKMTAQI